MKNKILSVVIPNLNGAVYLKNTLNRYEAEKIPEVELIVVDGCSSDASQDVIRRYNHVIDKIIIQKDLGQSSAINVGFDAASGDWVCWQNSDDYFLVPFLKIVAILAENDRQNFLYGNVLLVDECGLPMHALNYANASYKKMLTRGMVVSNQSFFFKRDLLAAIGYLRTDLTLSFDYDFLLRMFGSPAKRKYINCFFAVLRIHDETKTSLLREKNREEFDLVRREHGVGKQNILLIAYFYVLRVFYLVARGEFHSLFRAFKLALIEKKKIG